MARVSKTDRLVNELQLLIEHHQNTREEVATLLDQLRDLMLDDTWTQVQMYALKRDLSQEFYPGIRISNSTIVLPGDTVIWDTGTPRYGHVVATKVLRGGPVIQVLFSGDSRPRNLYTQDFPALHAEIPEPEAHPLSKAPVLKAGKTVVGVGDRVFDRRYGGLGHGTVVYLVETPIPGAYIQFDTVDVRSQPVFIKSNGRVLVVAYEEEETYHLEPENPTQASKTSNKEKSE